MPALLRITATGRFVRTAPRIALPIRTVQRSIRACGACARREFERHAPTRRCCLPLEPEARRFVVDVAGRVQRAHERAERGPAGVLARRLHVLQQEQREVDLSQLRASPQKNPADSRRDFDPVLHSCLVQLHAEVEVPLLPAARQHPLGMLRAVWKRAHGRRRCLGQRRDDRVVCNLGERQPIMLCEPNHVKGAWHVARKVTRP
mmetsp:Transcript_27517/g.57942  ORF Transcript_27517/g.57942 Transcript_27517/m.57942 type:complete len:204 (-) Transcript_27517:522-1133(-)